MNDNQQSDDALDVRSRAVAFVATHGRDKTVVAIAGIVGGIGAILPLIPGRGGFSVAGSGLLGILLLAAPVALGLIPVLAGAVAARMRLALFGAACVLLGGYLGFYVVLDLISTRWGMGSVGLGFGFYVTLAAYAGLVYGLSRLAREETP
jgi:hypothetical protein